MSTDEKYVHEMSEVLFHSNYDSRLEINRFFFLTKIENGVNMKHFTSWNETNDGKW